MLWPRYKHIFFDCDSTLTKVEGIDILAETSGHKEDVEELTNAAMDGQLDLEDVYEKRLQTIQPTRAQILDIRRIYKKNSVEDAKEVIDILQKNGHQCYIISGGLAEPVEEFGIFLGVPRDHIRAVKVNYDHLSGEWWRHTNGKPKEEYLTFEEGALTVSDGKAQIVKELLGDQNGRSLLIGDGTSDLKASSAVDLFIGYGGVVARENVRKSAPIFIKSDSISPLLILATGSSNSTYRNPELSPIFKKAVSLIKSGSVQFNNSKLQQKFTSAYREILE